MRQQYEEINFRKASLRLIEIMNQILTEFREGGYTVTVRQLYYQLVARDVIENTEKSYKKITNLVNDARMAGMMDWDMIEDRTREFERRGHWSSPASIIKACGDQYHIDMWDNQETRIFCIVEKEALAGVLYKACYPWDVPLLAARGYPSVTVLREFAEKDIIPALENGQNVQIFHLGDHDPSGIDMTRDIEERLQTFTSHVPTGCWLHVERLGLNMDQIRDQRPPPNPAKVTDSRFADYEEKFGSKSWELDALSPAFLNDLVNTQLGLHIDPDAWKVKEAERQAGRDRILQAAKELKEEQVQAAWEKANNGGTLIEPEPTIESITKRIQVLEEELSANEEEKSQLENEIEELEIKLAQMKAQDE